MADFTYVTSTGVILPDTSNLQSEVQNEYFTAFGNDLIVTPDTPQGVLIAVEILARSTILQTLATLANQINPNLAAGIFLDAILALTGSQRTPATFTTVICTLTGVVGTVITEGAQVQDTSGNVYGLSNTVTIPTGGTLTGVLFTAINSGPLDVPASTVSQIISNILGWETVTNPGAGIPGSNTQSDTQARLLRQVTLAIQGISLNEAIISNLYLLEGVTSVGYRENYTSAPLTIDGYTLLANSIYAIVAGGDQQAIADLIRSKKTGGTNWNGSVVVNSTDPFSNQVYPVHFDRPTLIPILIQITVTIEGDMQDPQDAIINAILAYANQTLGSKGFAIGNSVSCFEIAAAVDAAVPNLYIHLVETSLSSPVSYSTDEIPIKFFQQATTQAGSITVIVE